MINYVASLTDAVHRTYKISGAIGDLCSISFNLQGTRAEVIFPENRWVVRHNFFITKVIIEDAATKKSVNNFKIKLLTDSNGSVSVNDSKYKFRRLLSKAWQCVWLDNAGSEIMNFEVTSPINFTSNISVKADLGKDLEKFLVVLGFYLTHYTKF